MNFKATASSIAASGGIRPDSHITARPVTAIKAGSVALTLGGVPKLSVRMGDFKSAQYGSSQPRLTLTGQRRYTDERLGLGFPVGATSRSGGRRLKPCEELQSSRADYNLGNPCAEKVWPHRSRQNKGAAPLTKAPSAFRLIGGAVRQGTLTITGSNVRLGTEMPVALSSFSL